MKLIILSTFLIIYGCNVFHNGKITIENKTNIRIDSIIIDSHKLILKYIDINAGKKMTKSFNINSGKNHEGAFRIRVYTKDTLRNAGTFGYFSNENDLKDNYDLVIYNDDFKFRLIAK